MNQKDFLHFGQIVYLECQQTYFMFSRGFIDDQLHLSHQKHVECEFTFQQKNTQSKQRTQKQKKQPIIFGTQILIKHCYSNYYLSFINEASGGQRVVLTEQINQSCIFELVPQRTFEHKGDFVTINSSFAIRQTLIKSYIGSNILEMDPTKLKFSEDKLFESYQLNRLITARKESEEITHSYNMRLKSAESKHQRQEFQRFHPQEQLSMNQSSPFFNNYMKQEMLEEQKMCTLPIAIGQGQRSNLLPCSIQRHSYTMWRAHRKQQNQAKYFKDNDYIYFVSSVKSKGTMTVNFAEEDRSICKIQFVNKHNQLEYDCSAIFIVQIQTKKIDNCASEQHIYLKHLLTGKYFPFNEQNVKKKLKLVPLLPLNNLQNKLPPFHIFFNGQYFPSEEKNYQATCGFWLNKVNKLEINQILSLEGISHQKWISYLTNYLDKQRSKRQQLLRQFGLLKFMIYIATNQIKQLREIYTLIFKMINQNRKVRKQMASYISQLLKKQTKEYIIDILSETLNNEDNFVEKYVQPEHLNHEITDFKIQQTYSITYLRIFRLFCGNYNEPCQRNQNALFQLFFHEEESSLANSKYMSQSYLSINRNKISEKYKFKLIFKSKTQLQIENCGQKYELKQLQQQKVLYLRQYLYLLGDCLKKNKPKLEQFKRVQAYKLLDLIDVLYIQGAERLQGPILSLINTIYLEPQYKHKLYVYIKDYDQMCYQGSLIALQQNQDTKRLLSFINSNIDQLNSRLSKIQSLKKQIDVFQRDSKISQELNNLLQSENKVLIEEYTSTKFKRFLITIKYTIQSSYWYNINNLELIVDALYKLYTTRTKQEKLLRLKLQSDYSQVKQWRNYLDSTVIIIQIAILFLDIKINICISNLVNLEEDKIETEINSFIKDLQNNSHFHRHFDYFQLCDAQNEETMRKFLILSRRYYEIKSIIYEKYNEAMKQRSSKVSMKLQIQFIKQNIEQLKSCGQKNLRFCREYIVMCCKDTKIQQITLQKQKSSTSFSPLLNHKKIASQYQILALKLGIIGTLRENIDRYINLRSKEKVLIQQNIYWQLLLFYILIRNNSVVKKEINSFRQKLIHIVNEQNENSLIAIDILSEIYEDNRSLLVSDRQSIRQICILFVEMLIKQLNPMYQSKNAQNKMKILNNIKINKLIYLILSFLTVNGKRIKNNYSLIAKELFDKEVIMVYICKFKSIQNRNSLKPLNINETEQMSEFCSNSLFQILLFVLAETLGQKLEKLKFSLPKIDQINSLLLLLGKQNWKFTFSIFHLIYQHSIEINQDFVKILRNTLNSICEIALQELKQKEESSLFQENEDLQLVLLNFLILIKIILYVVTHYGSPKMGILQIQNPKFIQKMSYQKLDLVEKLFLFRIYLPHHLASKLFQLANMSQLNLKEQDIFKLQLLRIKNLKADILKSKNTNLIKSQEFQQGIQLEKSKVKKYMLKRESMGIAMISSENIIEWVQQISKLTKMKPNILKFQIKQAQQFIKSLIFINKTDSNYLDLQLKEFFISFLINSFPYRSNDFEQGEEAIYNEQLINHQNQFVQYAAADLVTILLQQKFNQNYGIFINIFQFGNKLLQGGNQKAQSSFYKLFLIDHKNTIFENILFIIENSFIAIKFYFQSHSKSSNTNYIASNDVVYNQIHDFQTLKERRNVCQILKKVFRFLQLLCQNDNQDLKKYVMKQINQNKVVKYMSINFLQIANNIFLQITKLLKQNFQNLYQEQKCNNQVRESMKNLLQIQLFILDFLIQVCQYPAFSNQFFICQSNFFNCLRDINTLGLQYKTNFDEQNLVFKVKRKIVILIRGLLEQKNTQIIESLRKKLQVQQLKEFIYTSLAQCNVTNIEQLSNKMAQNYSSLVEQIQNVVDILIICRILNIDIQNGMSLEYCEIIYELKKQIRQIEVCFRDRLTTIYFCYRPIFNYLSKETKEYFINRFSISESRSQKLKELLNQRQIINQDIQFRIQKKVISDTIINGLFNCSNYLCFILIALQLFFYSVTKAGIALDQIQYSIVKGLSYIQFIITVIYFITWGNNLTSITKQKVKTKYPFINQRKNTISDQFLHTYLILKEIYWQEGNSYHALILLFVSYFACFYELRIYALFVLYIFAKIQLLQSLLSAIRMTGGKLLLMCLLSSAFNFIFGILSINNYIKVIYENQTIDIDIQHLSSHCTTLLTCIQSLFTQRIIGQTPSRQGDNSHYGRFFSDIVYWAFFDILIPNLTAAIIIDRFAELRNLKQKIEKQENNACLICFANKSSFERKNQDFEYHKLYTHNIWNYFYYLYYLQKLKSNTEYTGVEYWVIQQLKDEKIEWFPLDNSENDDDLSETKITRLLQALKYKTKNKQEDGEQIQE